MEKVVETYAEAQRLADETMHTILCDAVWNMCQEAEFDRTGRISIVVLDLPERLTLIATQGALVYGRIVPRDYLSWDINRIEKEILEVWNTGKGRPTDYIDEEAPSEAAKRWKKLLERESIRILEKAGFSRDTPLPETEAHKALATVLPFRAPLPKSWLRSEWKYHNECVKMQERIKEEVIKSIQMLYYECKRNMDLNKVFKNKIDVTETLVTLTVEQDTRTIMHHFPVVILDMGITPEVVMLICEDARKTSTRPLLSSVVSCTHDYTFLRKKVFKWVVEDLCEEGYDRNEENVFTEDDMPDTGTMFTKQILCNLVNRYWFIKEIHTHPNKLECVAIDDDWVYFDDTHLSTYRLAVSVLRKKRKRVDEERSKS